MDYECLDFITYLFFFAWNHLLSLIQTDYTGSFMNQLKPRTAKSELLNWFGQEVCSLYTFEKGQIQCAASVYPNLMSTVVWLYLFWSSRPILAASLLDTFSSGMACTMDTWAQGYISSFFFSRVYNPKISNFKSFYPVYAVSFSFFPLNLYF